MNSSRNLMASLAAITAFTGAATAGAVPASPGNIVVAGTHAVPRELQETLGQEFALLSDGFRVQAVFAAGDTWIVCNAAAGSSEAACSTMPARDWWTDETVGGWGPPGQVLAYYPRTLEDVSNAWSPFQSLRIYWPLLSGPWQGQGEWTSCFGMRLADELVPAVTIGGSATALTAAANVTWMGKQISKRAAAAVFVITTIAKLLDSTDCGRCGVAGTVFQDWQLARPLMQGMDYRMCLDPEAFEQATLDDPDTDFDFPLQPPASHLPTTVVREAPERPDASVEVEYALIVDNGDGTFTVYLDDGTVLVVSELAQDMPGAAGDKEDEGPGHGDSGSNGGRSPGGVGTEDDGGPTGGGGYGDVDRELDSDLELPDGGPEDQPPPRDQQGEGEEDDNGTEGDK